ncbi:MAG: response regulator, partial [Flavobacteriales bacterium]|nr:response regulator [Flavobacteriales bacterium]
IKTNYDISGVRVLLVEDHKINQVYATIILEEENAVVELAENGKEAIEFLNKSSFDVVLMDNQMPVMGGIEATKIIRNQLKLEIPIIAITANAFKGDSDIYIKAGMDEYISKPFKDTELIAKIGKILNKSSLSDKNVIALKVDDKEDKNPSIQQDRLYSLSFLQEMSRGKQEFVDKMVRMFIEECSKSLSLLNKHHENLEYERVAAIAHRMGPSIDMMKMETIRESVQQIEEFAGSETNLEQLPQLITEVNAVCQSVIEQLKERF